MSISEKWRRFKPLPEDINKRLLQLTCIFEEEKVLLAYLFGNLAGEDIDLGVLLYDVDRLSSLREKLYEKLDTQRIDLINLKNATPLLKFEIIKTGILIYKESDEIENKFELSVIHQYRDTAYLRKRQNEILIMRLNQRWC
jgi:predicted nucleotidyltransferase